MLPTLVVRDPELIKHITVKDFDHFLDHRSFINEEVDLLWSKNLFALKGEVIRESLTFITLIFICNFH